MTRTPHDQFSKQILQDLLYPLGQTQMNRTITAEPRAADLWFVPYPDAPGIESLGLLGQMVQTACLFEPFRNPIQADDVLACVGKLADLYAELQRQAKREGRSKRSIGLPQLWILTPTASVRVLQGFVENTDRWTSGFYFAPVALRTGIVVIHQLPKMAETLWLRLLGRGQVQAEAIAELVALSWQHPLKRHAMEQLAILRINLELRQNLNKAEQELVMNLSPVYEQWRQATLQEGEAIGRQQGEAIGRQQGEAIGRQQGEASLVIRLLTRRFQQDLSAELRSQIESLPLSTLENLAEALLDFSTLAELEAWLAANL